MNKMQCYFGMAIRSNTDSLFLMKKGVGAILFHCCTADYSATSHRYCPQDENTWCRYWKAVNRGEGDTFEEKDGLPDSINKILRPIFDDVSNDTLLSKCLHGMTQNNNESLNGVVWKRIPKEIYVGRETMEIGTASAVINYNEGLSGIANVFKSLNMIVGHFSEKFFIDIDTNRVMEMNVKSSQKARRKKLGPIRKRYEDKATEVEGEICARSLHLSNIFYHFITNSLYLLRFIAIFNIFHIF